MLIVAESAIIRDHAMSTQSVLERGEHPPEVLRVLATGVRLNERGLIVTAAKPFIQVMEQMTATSQASNDEFVYLNYLAMRHTERQDGKPGVRIDWLRARITGPIALREDLGIAILDGGDRHRLDTLGVRPLALASSRCADGDEVGVCGFASEVEMGTGSKIESLVPWFSTAIVSSSFSGTEGGRGGFDHHFRLNGLLQRGYLGAPVFDFSTGAWVGIVTDEGNVDGSADRPRGFVRCTDTALLAELETEFYELERGAFGAPKANVPFTIIPIPQVTDRGKE